MGDNSDAYKMATEAGREATKQLLVVTGGLLAGYLAFIGRPNTEQVLDQAWSRFVVTVLFFSIFFGSCSLAFAYLMHAARSRRIEGGEKSERYERRWERAALLATLGAFSLLLCAILTIVITAYC